VASSSASCLVLTRTAASCSTRAAPFSRGYSSWSTARPSSFQPQQRRPTSAAAGTRAASTSRAYEGDESGARRNRSSSSTASQYGAEQRHEQERQSRLDELTAIGAPISSKSAKVDKKNKGPIRDTDIRSSWIYLVDFTGAAGGGLTGPHRKNDILAKIDRKRFWLQQVASGPGMSKSRKPQEGEGESVDVAAEEPSQNLPQHPVCKLVAKKDEFDQQRAASRRKAEARSGGGSSSSAGAADSEESTGLSDSAARPVSRPVGSAPSAKDLQLTWSSTVHDISHKLAKAKRDLIARAPSSRLTIRITTKRGSGRHVGTPGTKHYIDEQARKKEFLDSLHAAMCCRPEDEGKLESADIDFPGGSIAGGGVAKLSSEGVQWRTQGAMALLVYEPVV